MPVSLGCCTRKCSMPISCSLSTWIVARNTSPLLADYINRQNDICVFPIRRQRYSVFPANRLVRRHGHEADQGTRHVIVSQLVTAVRYWNIRVVT